MKNQKSLRLGVIALSLLLSGPTTMLAACSGSNEKPAVSAVPGQPVDLTYAAEKTVNSVVYIQVKTNSKTQTIEYEDPFADFFGDFFGRGGSGNGIQRRQIQTPEQRGSGSGVILTSDGYIVTNNHVVNGADEIEVKLNDNREFKARIIGQDKTTDLALIKIEAKNLQPITVGSSDDLKLGEWVLAVGNPFNFTSTVTAGIVSAKARSLHASDGIESFIQTDAAINPGNSGGALVNARGELVGINAMIYSRTGSYSGYSFAIPTRIVTKVVEDLKKYGTVQRAMLGIRGTDVSNFIDINKERGEKTPDLGTTEGVYVNEVTDGSAASEAGFEKGDVLISVDGKKIEKMSELQELLASHYPGDKVSITYLRDKKKNTKTVTLKNEQGNTSVVKEVDLTDLGVALEPLDADTKQQLNLSYGLEVKAVKAGPMQKAGIEKGIILMQINDRKMTQKSDFDEAVREANLTRDRVLWIRAKTKSGLNRSYTVELGSSKPNK